MEYNGALTQVHYSVLYSVSSGLLLLIRLEPQWIESWVYKKALPMSDTSTWMKIVDEDWVEPSQTNPVTNYSADMNGWDNPGIDSMSSS